MPLILAIEPDRRQASQLTAIVRGRLHAEFVLADSAERALEALGHRVPDLVLTTALLSPKDEATLSERLRALDGAAAHVQTLTIPVLATPGRRGRHAIRTGGVLSSLLGDRGDDDGPASGCDPAMFAEQCKEYLERSAHERATFAEHAAEAAPELPEPITITREPSETVAPEPESFLAPASATTISEPPSAISEPPAAAAPTESPIAEFESVVAPPTPVRTTERPRRSFFSAATDEPPESLMAVVAAFAEAEEQDALERLERQAAPVQSTEPESSDAVPVVDETPVVAAANDDDRSESDENLADVDLSSMLDDGLAKKARAVDEEQPVEVYELDAADNDPGTDFYTPLPRPEARSWPILEDLATGASNVEQPLAIGEEPREEPRRRESDDWMDIIEAIRRDAEPAPIRRVETSEVTATVEPAPEPAGESTSPITPETNSEMTAAAPMTAEEPAIVEPPAVTVETPRATVEAPAAIVEAPSATVEAQPATDEAPPVTSETAATAEPGTAETAANPEPTPTPKKRRRASPVQDEWGFFDPDRAGFAALLAKLEEITDSDEPSKRRRR